MMRGLHGQALKVVQDCLLSGLTQPLFTCCMAVCLVREPVARTVCVHACPCVCVCVCMCITCSLLLCCVSPSPAL